MFPEPADEGWWGEMALAVSGQAAGKGCGCEGDTGMRPLVYRDTLRQGQAKQM